MIVRIRREKRTRLLTLGICIPEGNAQSDERATPFHGFERYFLKPAIPWRGVLASALLHCGCIALVSIITLPALYQEREEMKLRVVSIQPLRIRLPEQLFVARPKATQALKPKAPSPAKES